MRSRTHAHNLTQSYYKTFASYVVVYDVQSVTLLLLRNAYQEYNHGDI